MQSITIALAMLAALSNAQTVYYYNGYNYGYNTVAAVQTGANVVAIVVSLIFGLCCLGVGIWICCCCCAMKKAVNNANTELTNMARAQEQAMKDLQDPLIKDETEGKV